MRVLMLSWDYPPSAGGGLPVHVAGLAHGLQRAGHEVAIITRRTPGTDHDTVDPDGVRILRADVDLPWLPDRQITRVASANHALAAAAAPLRDWRPDIVHAHDWGVAWAASDLAAWVDAPLVTTFHGTERSRHAGHLPPGPSNDINTIEWWLSGRSDRVITSTRLMVRELVDGFELDPDRVHRIPPGIDPTWWRTLGPDEQEGERRGGRVFAWGRVQYEKGFQVLAEAIGQLRYRVIGLECTIAGRGSYLPELQSQIDIAGAGDVIDLPGYVSGTELRAAVHRAACVVIPSLYEPFGLVALEALAGGAPLIVANTGGLAELVAGTGAAQLFEPGNPDELADCIERVITDEHLATQMSERGAELLEASYSWGAIARRTLAVYEHALA